MEVHDDEAVAVCVPAAHPRRSFGTHFVEREEDEVLYPGLALVGWNGDIPASKAQHDIDGDDGLLLGGGDDDRGKDTALARVLGKR